LSRDDDFGRLVKILILTGCRREEVGALEWNEIDFDTGIMAISAARTKNRKALVLTLPPMALEILKDAPRREGRKYVFGSRGGAFAAWSYSTIALHGRITTAEGTALPHWVLHDLRRTFRSGLGRLGVPPHVAELCINHVRGGIAAVYDKYRYEREIKAALALWADHVAAVVEGRERKVVALPTMRQV
jgi:integrase